MERENTNVEAWTVDDLVGALSNPTKKRKIILPRFQRSIVWKREAQESFIESVKRGFPVGAILLSQTGSDAEGNIIFQIIDGLQRSTTLKKYIKEPNLFFSIDDAGRNFAKQVLQFLKFETTLTLEQVEKTMLDWVRSLKGFQEFQGFSSYNLATKFDEMIGEKLEKSQLFELTKIITPYLKTIGDEANISSVKIPVIIYSGNQDNLPQIFERLNSKGTALSKYQVFAAAWGDHDQYRPIQITNRAIMDQIKGKYDRLEDEGLEIENYNPDEFYSGDFSVFEYFFGLGKHIVSKYQYLFGGGSANSDQADSIAFNLGTICLGLDTKNMGKQLPKTFLNIGSVEKFESALMDSIDFVDTVLKPFIGLRANRKAKQNSVPSVYHTEMQIVSFIGKVFRSKYDEKIEISPDWNTKEKNLKKNIPHYYLYDILRDYWRGSGDTKSFEFANSERYEREISKVSWENVLDEFHTNELEKQETSRVKIKDSTILFLKYIYTHLFTAGEELSNVEFEIEHIIPVQRLKKLAESTSNGLPIGAVSNLCLLEKDLNRIKGDQTIYEYYNKKEKDAIDDKSLNNIRLERERVEERAFITKEDLEFLDSPESFNRNNYEVALKKRFQFLKERFFSLNQIA